MTKQRRVIYNLAHLNSIDIYLTTTLHFSLDYRSYFLGDKIDNKNLQNAHIDLTTQSLSLGKIYKWPKELKVIKALQLFTHRSSIFYCKKLKFIGKGYKIKKTKLKKSFKLYLGHAHVQYIFSGGLRFKKLSKYRLLLLTNNKKKLNRITSLVLKARALNRYTKRGLRNMRQFILKRPGKKSSY